MELYAGLPYWIIKNPLNNYFNPLRTDEQTEVVIIGSGITGALVAHELCSAGIKCGIVDKRDLSSGSSAASTALLQYEIDTPLFEMAQMLNEILAVKAYESCLQSITDIENVFKSIGYNPDFEKVSSVFYASNKKGLDIIKREYVIRKKHNLPVDYLSKEELKEKYGINAPGALSNHASAQMDAYAAATHLIDYHMKSSELKVFTHTMIDSCNEKGGSYEVISKEGKIIRCGYVVIAAGFEADKFLPKKIMKLTSSYALISQPLEEGYIWPENSLIWETHEPYLYIRTSNKNRIIVGGEDIEFKNPRLRDILLRKKTHTLETKIKKLFPEIPFVTDMAWCGTFSSTDDGLPFIGNWPGNNRMFYALGYGGNGITFSMIAAQIIKNKLKGIKDDREEVFSFERTN